MRKVYRELHPAQIAVLMNPTEEKAVAFIRDAMGLLDPNPKNALAGVHKARLSWGGSTNEMIEESKKWLTENGYSPTYSPFIGSEE